MLTSSPKPRKRPGCSSVDHCVVPPPTPSSTSSTTSLYDQYYNQHVAPVAATPLPASRTFSGTWMHGNLAPSTPSIRVEQPSSQQYQHPQPAHHDFAYYDTFGIPHDWQMYQGQLQGQVQNNYNTLPRRNRGHQRQASDSTIGSTGPASPFNTNSAWPYISNTDSPTSATFFEHDASSSFSKHPRTDSFQAQAPLGYIPSQLLHSPAAHFAMKSMAIDHHNPADDPPDFAHSSRYSESSHGRNSPSTPRTGADESDEKAYRAPSNDYRQAPLFRTESAAYQDELYNPANFLPSAQPQAPQQPPQQKNTLLSPHRNLVNERIKTANSFRSQSPAQAPSRDRSPFRHGSQLAPTDDFKSPGPVINTAADARRQQKEEADRAEYAQHAPQLRRELTKTMSPQDALLDYNGDDQDGGMPLFSDSIPMGYQKHFGGSEAFANDFISGTNQAYGQFAPSTTQQPNVANFRASSSGGNPGATPSFNFQQPSAPTQVQSQPSYMAQHLRSTSNNNNISNNSNNNSNNSNTVGSESTPDFPAHLTSMESSMSENGAPQSSQDSSASIQRPANTSAATGTYTCTSQGCVQRFESPAKLQKHKREAHQPTESRLSSETAETGSSSPRSSMSPESTSGMTSSALLARNSQAGPHKCARTNPSTGKPCNSIFSRPYDLTRHEDTIHNRGKQKVRCQYCREEKSFSRNDALTRHMRVVHPEIDFQGKRSSKRDY